MRVANEEHAARREERIDRASPGIEIAEPTEHPDARIDDVEGAAHMGGSLVDRRLDERAAVAEPRRVGETPGRPDRLGGEVDAHHLGAESRPAQSVGADVALQVRQPETRDTATRQVRFEKRPVFEYDVRDTIGLRGEAIDPIPLEMRLDPVIPVRSVGGRSTRYRQWRPWSLPSVRPERAADQDPRGWPPTQGRLPRRAERRAGASSVGAALGLSGERGRRILWSLACRGCGLGFGPWNPEERVRSVGLATLSSKSGCCV